MSLNIPEVGEHSERTILGEHIEMFVNTSDADEHTLRR